MDVTLAKILKFLNGAIAYDDDYKFALFCAMHYIELCDWTLEEVIEKSNIKEESILSFIGKLGFKNYDEFYERVCNHQMARLDQIRARMIGLSSEDFVRDMEKDVTDEEMLIHVSRICEEIDQADRVIIVGALYPMSIHVEFQTDLITFGKPVIQFKAFDKTMTFKKGDLIIFISATGRAMRGFLAAYEHKNVGDADSILITQNPIYTRPDNKIAKFVLQVPGRFDGINFNYQIMKIFDLLRIHYYQQYYLRKTY